MARRKRYSRTNLILFILICCIVLIYFLSKDTLSKFESEIKGSSDTDIAFYVLEDSLQTHELLIGDFKPGDLKSISFNVSNHTEDRVAEVDLSYIISLKCTENLPLNYYLYEDTNQINNTRFEKDDYGTWFYYMDVPERQLTHGTQVDHLYRLDIEFPSDKNDPKYQDIIEAIEITVNSHQIIQ